MFVILALVLATAAVPAAPIISPGCQGEACWDSGIWIVKAPLPLYAKPGAAKPIATLPKGTRVTALRGIVRTTRVGLAMLKADLRDYESGKLNIILKKGTRIHVIYDVGEGVYAALAPNGRRVQVSDTEMREIVPFRADDWVEVRLANRRTGWIRHDYDRLDCSSHYDDHDRCRALGAGLR